MRQVHKIDIRVAYGPGGMLMETEDRYRKAFCDELFQWFLEILAIGGGNNHAG